MAVIAPKAESRLTTAFDDAARANWVAATLLELRGFLLFVVEDLGEFGAEALHCLGMQLRNS